MDYLEKRNKCKVEKNEQLLRWNLSLKNKLYYFICEHNACGAFFFLFFFSTRVHSNDYTGNYMDKKKKKQDGL